MTLRRRYVCFEGTTTPDIDERGWTNRGSLERASVVTPLSHDDDGILAMKQGKSRLPDTRGDDAPAVPALDPPHQGMDAEATRRGILRHLEFTLGEFPHHVLRGR